MYGVGLYGIRAAVMVFVGGDVEVQLSIVGTPIFWLD